MHVRARRSLSILVLVTAALLPSCYHYRVAAPGPEAPATEWRGTTANAYLWGLVQDPPVIADNCKSEALHDVRVSTNFGYVLISFLTLGIWVPLDVEWRCAKIPQPEGEL